MLFLNSCPILYLCISLISLGNNAAELGERQRCKGMNNYYDCMEVAISERCTPESLRIFLRSVMNFGCEIVTLPTPKKTSPAIGNSFL